MMSKRVLLILAGMLSLAGPLAVGAGSAIAQDSPVGVWIDHTGRGAVEIAPCGESLCGHVVWVKDAKNTSACRTQIIGDARLVSPKVWDKGWIFDPDDNSRYSVELRPVGADRLKVTGYMGTKLLSETMLWKRAPVALKRCDVNEAALPPATQPTAALPATVQVETPAAPKGATPSTRQASPEIAPPTPVRQAAATPPAARPEAAPVLAAPQTAEATLATAPAAVALNEAAATPDAAPAAPLKRKAAKQQRRKLASRDCRIAVPFVTVIIPCNG